MRVALIGDIHGNGVALDAALDDIGRRGVDEIVCLGDVAPTGPQPAEVLDRLADLGCSVVMGNVDAFVLEPKVENVTDDDYQRIVDIDLWTLDRLTDDHRRFVASFEPAVEVSIGGGDVLLCVHGSPRSFDEQVVTTMSDEEIDEVLAGVNARAIALGHTHFAMLRRRRDVWLFNPGSVGMAYERTPPPYEDVLWSPCAEYGIVEVSEGSFAVEFRRVPYDVETLVAAAKGAGMPHFDWWAAQWERP